MIILNFVFFSIYFIYFKMCIFKLNFLILLKYFNLLYFNLLSGLNSDMFFDILFIIEFYNDDSINKKISFLNLLFMLFNTLLFFDNVYIFVTSLFILSFILKIRAYISKIIILLINTIYFAFIYNSLNKYFFLKSSNYNFLYQVWYKFAKDQKNTYLSIRYRLVYLTEKFVKQEFLNDNMFKDEIQEYFVLRRKTFFDAHFKPVKVRKFTPLINLKRKFYTKRRRNYSLKGLLFFYFKDYEDRINKKEQQQKTLRIYEGIFGTYIYQELIKKTDQKQAKFVKMKLNRD